MEEGFNLKNLFSSYDEKYDGEDLASYNDMGDEIILSIFTIFICPVGLVGNGNIIWLLGFRVKRKPLATYILNLAVAEFGSLLFLLPLNILIHPPYFNKYIVFPVVVFQILLSLFMLMYAGSQLLLTAISIDRCVSVLFPNWYQRHRSPVLSTRVCALIWALSFVLGGMPLILEYTSLVYGHEIVTWSIIVCTLICFLLVTISALIMFIKVCFQSHQCQCGNLLKVFLLMFLSFLLFIILTYVCVITFFSISTAYYFLGTSLKSSINPLIYFLSGRKNGGKIQERMKIILQRVFKEDRDTQMELHPHIQILF